MRSTALRLALLVMPLVALPACGGRVSTPAPLFPAAADLAVEKKPMMPVEAITDDKVNSRYNSALEGWGDRGWSAVARICRWAAGLGMPVECPAP